MEVVKTPGSNVPFSIKPIMFELEGRWYVGPILLVTLADLLAVRQAADGNVIRGGRGGGGSSGGDSKNSKVGATGGGVRVWEK